MLRLSEGKDRVVIYLEAERAKKSAAGQLERQRRFSADVKGFLRNLVKKMSK